MSGDAIALVGLGLASAAGRVAHAHGWPVDLIMAATLLAATIAIELAVRHL